MQNLENDMDDLFRRAAEKYPLNTGQSNWESVEKKLSALPVYDEPQKPGTKNNYKKFGLLLLLMSISLVLGFLILNPNGKTYPAEINDTQTKQNHALINKPKVTENPPTGDVFEMSNGIIPKTSTVSETKLFPSDTFEKKTKTPRLSQPGKRNENNLINKNGSRQNAGNEQDTNNLTAQKKDSTATDIALIYPEIKDTTSSPEKVKNKPTLETKESSEKDLSTSEKKDVPASKNDAIKETRFFSGLITGPDFSKVKSAAFSNAGFSVGILAGYNITKSIFVETEVLIDTKYYSSEGSMFDKESASMPDEMTVNDLESRSNMLEIPIKIGYRFYQSNKTNLFAAAGFATYLVTKEKNNYNITENGTTGKMEGIYEKNDLTMPAVFNISFGWEQQLSTLLKIRIEPYLKLPVQGIGVGRLPVTSAGIQIGLVRDFK